MLRCFGEDKGPDLSALDQLIFDQDLNKENIQICACEYSFDINRCFGSRFTAYRRKYAGKWFMPQTIPSPQAHAPIS
jgi:hypothetical protein